MECGAVVQRHGLCCLVTRLRGSGFFARQTLLFRFDAPKMISFEWGVYVCQCVSVTPRRATYHFGTVAQAQGPASS